MLERVLERIAERMSRTSEWEGMRRADLVGRPGPADRRRPSPAEEGFSNAWGRMPLRDDDADEQTDYPGSGGAV